MSRFIFLSGGRGPVLRLCRVFTCYACSVAWRVMGRKYWGGLARPEVNPSLCFFPARGERGKCWPAVPRRVGGHFALFRLLYMYYSTVQRSCQELFSLMISASYLLLRCKCSDSLRKKNDLFLWGRWHGSCYIAKSVPVLGCVLDPIPTDRQPGYS